MITVVSWEISSGIFREFPEITVFSRKFLQEKFPEIFWPKIL